MNQSRWPLPLVLLWSIGIALLVDLIAAVGVGGYGVDPALLGLSSQPQNLAIALLFAVVARPLGEGLVFFGVMLPRLRASLGAWPGTLLTVAGFTLFRGLAYGGSLQFSEVAWYGWVVPLLLGLFYAVVRLRSRSTRALLLAMAVAGLLSTLIAFFLQA